MAAEDYSIRINVDSTSATTAQRNLQNLNSTVTQTERELNNTSSAARAVASNFSGLAASAKLAATALAAVSFKAAVSEMASFETKMLQLTALTGASATQIKSLEMQARSLGATTQFSAQQAAEAMGVLASAGLKTNEIMKATPNILQLAAAGALDLAKAAEISIAAMHGMGLELKDLQHINDVLVKAANDYTINVEMLGHAFGETAVVAKNYGVSLEAVASSLGILKESGMAAGSIGDALKTLFGALVNDTKDHQEILGRYTVGIDKHKMTYKDLSVEVLGYTKVLQNLKDAQIGATDMTKLFGESASTAAMGLSQHIDKIKENEKAYKLLNGTAQEQSELLNQGLAKAWDALKGTLSEAALQFGETGTKIDDTGKATGSLKTQLTDLIQSATGVIAIYENLGDEFAKSNKLTDEQYGHLKDIAGALRSFGGAVEGVVLLTGAIYGLRAAQLAFNAAAAMNPYIAGAAVLAGTVGYVQSKINEGQQKQAELVKQSTTVEEANLKVKQQIAKVAGIRAQDKLTIDKNLLERENATLKFLVAQREILEKKSSIVPDGIDGDFIKVKPPISKSLTDDDDKKTGSKKVLSEAQKEVNRQQEEYNRLIESTPYGEYNAKVDELSNALKNNGINQSTYSTLLNEANARLLDSTDYVKENTKAIDEQTQAKARAFEATARGKFEKGTEELRGQKPFMSENEYLNKQKEMTDAYLKDTGFEVKKDNSEQITKAYENEVEALEKIRREINLNDTAAYESAQRQKGFTDSQIESLMKLREEVSMTKLFDDMGLSIRGLTGSFSSMFSQVLTQGKSFTDALRGMMKSTITKISDGLMNFGMNAMMSGNFLAGAASMAGSVVSGLLTSIFKDKTTNTTLADTKLTDSNSIQNVIRTLNDIHAKEYKELRGINDNFTMLSKGIDNTIARAIAWNGSFVPSTNGMKTTDTGALNKQFVAGLGTTAISAGLASAGIGTGLAMTATAAAINASVAVTGAASALTGALVSTSASLAAGGLAAAAAMGGIGLLIGGAIYGLGKILGIGKTKYTAIGAGLVTEPAKMIDVAAGKAFEAFNFSTVKAVTKGWISNTTKIFDVINSYNDQISAAFADVFGGLFKTLAGTITDLGIGSGGVMSNLQNAVIPMMKVTLSGKTDAEVSDIIGKLVNTMTDKLATEIVGGMVAPFQKAGESTLETLYRLAGQVAVVKGAFHKLGVETDLTGMGAIAFADSIATIYESSINAKDGMKQFTSSINDFYNAVLTAGEKTALTISDYKSFVTENPQLGLSADPSKVTGSQMMAAFLKAKEASESAAKAADSILAIGQDVKNAYAPETSNELKTLLTSSAWSDKISGDYKNITPESFATGWWDIVQKRASTVGQENQNIYKEMVSVALSNQAKVAQGLPVAQAAGITSLEQQEQAAANAVESVNLASKNLKEVTDMSAAFNTIVNEFQNKYKAIDESILKSVTTQSATTKRARDKELAELKKVDDVRIASTEISIEARKEYAKLTKTTVESNDAAGYLTSTLQEVAWSMDDAAKATSNLADSGKFLFDFSGNFSKWVKNLRATSMGSPESQINAARSNFEQTLQQARFGVTGEEKRTALSEITSYADTYMNAIKSFYGSSEAGQKALEEVINQVSGLEKAVPVAELQLNALQDIKDAINTSTIEIPKGISDTNKEIYKNLLTETKLYGDIYKVNPDVTNKTRYDAFASLVLMIDKSAKSSDDSKFIDKIISSVGGQKGLAVQMSLVINNADIESGKKTEIIDNVLSKFNEKVLTLNNFSFDVKDAIDAAKETVAASWNPPVLDVNDVSAKTKLSGLSTGLKEFDNSYYDSVIDVNNSSAITKLNEVIATANAASSALSALGMAQAAKPIPYAATNADITGINPSANWSGVNLTTVSDQLMGYSGKSVVMPKEGGGLPRFAKGGITNKPAIFGEAGTEAAVPLEDGRSIPVTLFNSANDSSTNNAETIAELKAQNRKLELLINTMMEISKVEREKTQELISEVNGLRTDTRLKARV